MQSVNWAWGLSLIALTIAIHAMGVAVMAIVGGGTTPPITNRRMAIIEHWETAACDQSVRSETDLP